LKRSLSRLAQWLKSRSSESEKIDSRPYLYRDYPPKRFPIGNHERNGSI
jgi:hypothetical protein